jgi:hypothetical protein
MPRDDATRFAPRDAAVILGTSRGEGNTRIAVNGVVGDRDIVVVDLAARAIGPYDYAHANVSDDFMPIAEMLAEKSLWLLATPVYWYTMSGQMKIFVDRLSDLVTIRKDLGRRLRGKTVAVIATGSDDELPEGFEAPFRLTCGYFAMRYAGAFYWAFGSDDRPDEAGAERARAFGASLLA